MLRINRRAFLAASAVAATGLLLGADGQFEPDDARSNPDFFEHSIRNISDADLFAAIDLTPSALKEVRRAVEAKDYPGAYRAWAEYWSTVADDRGRFYGEGDLLMNRAAAVQSLEPRRAQVIADADVVAAHKITGWGDVTIQHGPVVDFNADYGRSGKYGFNYWGWSRKLIDAYLLTSDPKYASAFEEMFNQWYEQRNRIHGEISYLDVVYYELGLGLRCRPFLEFYCCAKPKAIATNEHILKAMLGAGRWLYEEEKRKYRGGNWQIMGSFGLAWIGTMLSEFSDAEKWVRMGTERLVAHVEKDFFPDGCHSERVPSSYMLVAYRDPRNLAALLNDRTEYADLSKQIRPKLKRTLEWYFATLPPDGIIPAINDGSRGPMPEALISDARDLFHMPATRRSDSVFFPESGFTAMRSDGSADALYMLINHGPTGGGHSHADSLDFQLHAFGQALAIDSGIGRTYDDANQAAWYVHTRAHNALVVDDADLNRKEAQGVDVAWTSLKTLDFFAATHNGYLESKGVSHRRSIAFVKPNYWFIFDTIDSKTGEHQLSWNLHCPTEMEQFQNGFASRRAPGLIVLPASNWKRGQSKGPASVRGIRGFEGKDFAEIDWIWFESSSGGAPLGTLLFPYQRERPDVKLVTVKQEASAAHFTLETADGVDHLLFNSADSDDFLFRGDFAWIRYQNGKPVSYTCAKTLTLKIGGNLLVKSGSPRDSEGNF